MELPKGWHIEYNPKPIPIRACDWDWWHDDYDGPECPLAGCSSSYEKALEEIQEIIDDI